MLTLGCKANKTAIHRGYPFTGVDLNFAVDS